jgi:predicted metal-dependent hydrolase
MHQINLDQINIDVVLKNIKNMYLAILPPLGKVRISAPKKTKLESIKMFALTKLNWIKKQQAKMLKKPAKKDYINNEEHYFLGEKYLLNVVQTNKKASVEFINGNIVLNIKAGFTQMQIKNLLQNWYRSELKKIVWKLIIKWEKIMNLQIAELHIRQMKTRWGSCHITKKKIVINLELAEKPLHCLEYVVVHEMVHFFERKHNQRFKNYMTYYLPNWQVCKKQLNSILIDKLL